MNYAGAKAFILDKLERELSDKLYYHGIHHTLDVLNIVDELCDLEEVDGEALVLLRTAALFHDSGFTIASQEHERLGCEIAQGALPYYGYSAQQIEQICGMIMATKIPQSPKTHLEEIMCDADLDYLGRDDFYSIGQSLFKELSAFGILSDEKKWNGIQVKFLEGHHFHTQTNIQRRNPIKQSYLQELKDLVASYGEIS